MATQQEVIKRFMASLDTTTLKGSAALDAAINYATSGASRRFSTIKDAIDKMVKDCEKAKSGDDFLKTYCGINLDNTDTGAITGSDAGGSTTKTAKSVVPESGSLDENFTGNSFPANGLTINLAQFPKYDTTGKLNFDNRIPDNYFEDNPAKKYIWQAFKTWWANGALDLIAESYGSNYAFGDNSNPKVLYFGFIDVKSADGGYLAAETQSFGGYIRMAVNMAAYGSLKNGGNSDGISTNVSVYLDRTIAHEMTHAIMMANIDNYDSLPQFIKEGVAELTIGIDDKRKDLIKELSSNAESLESALNVNDTGTLNATAYAGGYMFLRWLAKQASDSGTVVDGVINNTTNNASITTTDADKIIKNSGKYVTITTGAGNDSIYNDNGSNVSMIGGKGNDTLFNMQGKYVTIDTGDGNDEAHTYEGNSVRVSLGSGKDFFNAYHGKNISVYGGNDDDTILGYGGENLYYVGGAGKDYIHIHSGAKNSTINGGKGNDTISLQSVTNNLIIYKPGDGNDSISGFNATSTLRFGSSTNVSLQTKNNDVIATIGKGKITLTGAASLSAINIQGSGSSDSIRNSVSSAKIDALGGNDTITNSGSKVTINGGAGNDKIYNYASGKVTISGGNGADTIINYGAAASMIGGTGNDVIWGDAGKDTIRGGSNNDKLHGDAGNDKIYGDSGNDSIWGGTGNDSLWGGSGNDVFIYKPGEGTDRIFDYSSGDMLKILEADGSKGSFTKSKFSGGDLTLTINGGGTVILENVTAGDKFNINGKTYTISGTKLVK